MGSRLRVGCPTPTVTAKVVGGNPAVNAYGWYLNKQLGWERYFAFEFMDREHNLAEAQLALIKGGETCLWTSNFNAGDSEPVLWPGAAAAAERLWSPFLNNASRNATSALPRLETQMCRMFRRGHNTAAVTSNGFCGRCTFVPFEAI